MGIMSLKGLRGARLLSCLAAGIIGAACLGGPALAHHSSVATYHPTEKTAVEGVIKEFRFKNPHVIIYLDVDAYGGESAEWMAEGPSATGMRRENWTRDTLKPGDRVRVTGDATNDGSPMVWIDTIDYLDAATGALVATISPGTDPVAAFAAGALDEAAKVPADTQVSSTAVFLEPTLPDGFPNFTGISIAPPPETRSGAFFQYDPEKPYNETGAAAEAAYDLADDPQVFCDPPGLVRQGGYTPYGMKITQSPDRLLIEYEEYGGRRDIPFTTTLPEPGPKTPLGDSIAWYDGDTIMIETVNLLSNPAGHMGGPLSDEIMVMERLSRYDDPELGTQLKVTMTVMDPVYFRTDFFPATWTISRTMTYTDDYEYIEIECVPPLRDRSADALYPGR